MGATYSFLDTTVEGSTTYYYWLEEVSADGLTALHGPVRATALLGWRLRPVRPCPAPYPVPEDLK